MSNIEHDGYGATYYGEPDFEVRLQTPDPEDEARFNAASALLTEVFARYPDARLPRIDEADDGGDKYGIADALYNERKDRTVEVEVSLETESIDDAPGLSTRDIPELLKTAPSSKLVLVLRFLKGYRMPPFGVDMMEGAYEESEYEGKLCLTAGSDDQVRELSGSFAGKPELNLGALETMRVWLDGAQSIVAKDNMIDSH